MKQSVETRLMRLIEKLLKGKDLCMQDILDDIVWVNVSKLSVRREIDTIRKYFPNSLELIRNGSTRGCFRVTNREVFNNKEMVLQMIKDNRKRGRKWAEHKLEQYSLEAHSNPDIVLDTEECIQAYQISLALKDQYQALHFKDLYEKLLARRFLNIALNISELSNQLFEHYKQWKDIDLDLKAILTAIIVRSMRRIKAGDKDKLSDFLAEDFAVVNSKIEEMQLKPKEEKELIELFYEYSKSSQVRKITREVGTIAQLTDKLDEAKDILELIKPNSNEYIDKPIIENIKRLKSAGKVDVSLQSRAAKASLNKNDSDTELLIYSLDKSLKDNLINEDEYDHAILDIANKVANEFPVVAFNLQNKLHQNWGNILDLQAKVSSVLYTVDLDLGFEYFKKIEVEHYKIETILDFIENNNEIDLLKSTVYKMLEHMKIDTLKYRVLYELSKKLPVEFEEIYTITSKILPLDDLVFDSDALIKYYKDHYVENVSKTKTKLINIIEANADLDYKSLYDLDIEKVLIKDYLPLEERIDHKTTYLSLFGEKKSFLDGDTHFHVEKSWRKNNTDGLKLAIKRNDEHSYYLSVLNDLESSIKDCKHIIVSGAMRNTASVFLRDILEVAKKYKIEATIIYITPSKYQFYKEINKNQKAYFQEMISSYSNTNLIFLDFHQHELIDKVTAGFFDQFASALQYDLSSLTVTMDKDNKQSSSINMNIDKNFFEDYEAVCLSIYNSITGNEEKEYNNVKDLYFKKTSQLI